MVLVDYKRGVHLPGAGLWLDPRDPQDLAFVSHAHSDRWPHIRRSPFVPRVEMSRGAAGWLSTGWGGVPWLTPIPSSNWGWT